MQGKIERDEFWPWPELDCHYGEYTLEVDEATLERWRTALREGEAVAREISALCRATEK